MERITTDELAEKLDKPGALKKLKTVNQVCEGDWNIWEYEGKVYVRPVDKVQMVSSAKGAFQASRQASNLPERASVRMSPVGFPVLNYVREGCGVSFNAAVKAYHANLTRNPGCKIIVNGDTQRKEYKYNLAQKVFVPA